MEGRNKELVIFGVILLVIGSLLSFYHVARYVVVGDVVVGHETIAPLMDVGILLIAAGIIFLALSLLYSTEREQPLT